MFKKTGVKILGLISNMNYFVGDDGKKYKIFGEDGVKKTANEFNFKYIHTVVLENRFIKLDEFFKTKSW